MSLQGRNKVEGIQEVQNANGERVAPASDEHALEQARQVAIGNDGQTSAALTAPGRASRVTIHAEFDAAGEVVIRFQDADGNTVTTRSKADVTDYQTDGSTDIFVTAAVASPHLDVEFVDTSGGANQVNYSVMVI